MSNENAKQKNSKDEKQYPAAAGGKPLKKISKKKGELNNMSSSNADLKNTKKAN